jgi:hypothetical protein
MKRLVYLSILMLSMTGFGVAANYNGGQAIHIREADTLYNDLFAAARYVEIFGPALGDIYVACERADIKAPVADDVFAACRDLTIKEPVGDNVVGFAQTIYVDSDIKGDLIAYGAELRLTEKAHIHGNLFLGTGEFYLDGATIDGNIDGGTGEAYLNGKIGGSVCLEAGRVRFDSLYAAGGGTQLILRKALDEKSNKFAPADLKVTIKTHKHFYQKVYFYWLLLSFLVVGILLISFCKGFSKDYLSYSQTSIWKHLGLGFLLLVVTPVVAAILLILILTIPLGVILAAVYLIIIYLSYIFTAIFLGNWIIRQIKKNGVAPLFWSLLVGILCVLLLDKIPLIGWLLKLAAVCFGMGSLIGYIWHEIKPAASTT